MLRRLAILIAYCGLGQSLFANLPDNIGFGPGMSATSGAGSAAVSDGASVYYNIAGLAAPQDGTAEIHRNSIAFGLSYQFATVYINSPQLTRVSANNISQGEDIAPTFGQNVALQLDLRDFFNLPKRYPVVFGLGASLFSLQTDLAQINVISQDSYNFIRIGRNAARPAIYSGFAAQVWPDRLSIGVGAELMVGGTAAISLDHLSLDTSKLPHNESQVSIYLKPKPVAGIIYRQPLGKDFELTTGLTYRAKVQADVDAKIIAELPISPPVTALFFDTEIAFFLPHTFVSSWQLKYKRFKFLFDLEFQKWDDFSLSTTRAKYESAPNFNNIFAFRTGFDSALDAMLDTKITRLLSLNLRTGYAFIPAVTPDQSGASNCLDNNKHIFSIGLNRVFPKLPLMRKEVTIYLTFQWQYWQPRTTTKNAAYPLSDGSSQPNYTYLGNLYVIQTGVTLRL